MKVPPLTWKIPELQVIKSKEMCSEPCSYILSQVFATRRSSRLLSGVLFLLTMVILIKKSDTFPNKNINCTLLWIISN